jgi:hypothetical protein
MDILWESDIQHLLDGRRISNYIGANSKKHNKITISKGNIRRRCKYFGWCWRMSSDFGFKCSCGKAGASGTEH